MSGVTEAKRGTGAVVAGSCLSVLPGCPDESVDAIVTDPPYGLANLGRAADAITRWVTGDRAYVPELKGFMGEAWDAFVPPPAVWDECYRVLKPGGHMAVFAGSRTQDLMALSIRLAGFEIRDSFAWLYGSGMPKGLDVSKAIDKKLGVERPVIGRGENYGVSTAADGKQAYGDYAGSWDITTAGSEEAAAWEGWNTAMKPGYEPIILARKPLAVGTVAENVMLHGTGAINVGACRIGDEVMSSTQGAGLPKLSDNGSMTGGNYQRVPGPDMVGRYPANVILSHAETCEDGACGPGCQVAALDHQSGLKNPASRFFYCAKAPTKERPGYESEDGSRVTHPTVKSLAIMRWLTRLIVPPGGLVVDPFAGSGTTVEAAILEGFRAIGIEMTEKYIPLIQQRIDRAMG